MPEGTHYYYLPCPLCLENVAVTKTDSYRVLPIDPAKSEALNFKPRWLSTSKCEIAVGPFLLIRNDAHNGRRYVRRVWLLHTRCLSFVQHIPADKLWLLMTLVEPTLLQQSGPLESEHGAFYAPPVLGNFMPKAASALIPSLPQEIWNMILTHDIGRLIFILHTAGYVSRTNSVRVPRTWRRFDIDTLDLQDSFACISQIDIGGRSYIRRISAIRVKRDPRPVLGMGDRLYRVKADAQYIAIKTDRMGIIDIAFERENDRPKWLLLNSAAPFAQEIYQFNSADLTELRIVRDTHKCRTLVPFSSDPKPTVYVPMHQLGSDYLYLYMVLTNPDRKILYYEQAVRIEFAMAQNDAKKADKSGSSLIRLWRRINPGRLVVDTIILPPEALRTVRLLSCVHKDSCQFPWFQFKDNGKWTPPFPPGSTIVSEMLAENILGI